MMTIFQSAFANRTPPSTRRQLSDVFTVHGSFLINKSENFKGGKAAFERVVQVSPNILQYRLNPINLLIAMYRYRDAGVQLRYLKSHNFFDRHTAQIMALSRTLAQLPDANLEPPQAESIVCRNRRLPRDTADDGLPRSGPLLRGV